MTDNELKLEDFRRDYLLGGLHREDLVDDPIVQFERWLKQAIDCGLHDPTAMTIATVNANGQPSQRIVLLKHLDARGFVFYTNYQSRKSADIAENKQVSLHFPWHPLERQVKVLGVAERVPLAESVKYFASRPRESQLAAWASQQSQKIDSRKFLLMQFESMKAKFSKGQVPLPDYWGGYRVVPEQIEFWQGGASRLHDRFEYHRCMDNVPPGDCLATASGDWCIDRLAP